MERAGEGAVAAILAEWPELVEAPGRAVVLCGPGNNGGDGFVVARLLRARGWEVEVFLYGDAERLPPDARANHDRWTEIGAVDPLPPPKDHPRWNGTCWRGQDVDLLVDAIFGIGLSRPLSRDLFAIAFAMANFGAGYGATRRVALDMPSGLQSDNGRVLGGCFDAELVVTFHGAKVGHYVAEGPRRCGRLQIVDIGIEDLMLDLCLAADADGSRDPSAGWVLFPPSAAQVELGAPSHRTSVSTRAVLRDRIDLVTVDDVDVRKRAGHKFVHGHAVVVAGGRGCGGAGRLAARAALRIGAGLVTVAPPPAALIENACRLGAIMLHALRDGDALRAMLRDERISALCIGPGLGLGAREAGLVGAALAAERPAVLDADALTLLAREERLRDVLHPGCVLTPHMGEFARLAPDLAETLRAPAETEPAYSKVDAARDLAARMGCTVLLKGPDTVIAAPSGQASVHAAAYGREAPWLATAGAGDVLAGLIAGLLARGLDPVEACESAAWLHVEAARAFGPGLIAEDLPEALPGVLRRLAADGSGSTAAPMSPR